MGDQFWQPFCLVFVVMKNRMDTCRKPQDFVWIGAFCSRLACEWLLNRGA
jgi:hypothetical protein